MFAFTQMGLLRLRLLFCCRFFS